MSAFGNGFKPSKDLSMVADISGKLPISKITLNTDATLPTTSLSKYVWITASVASRSLTLPSASTLADGVWVSVRNNTANSVNVNATALAANTTVTYVCVSNTWTKM